MAALDRLVGMFAFAIYDRPSETLTLVRDRFGKKPLYYCWEDDHFLFASELKALLRVMRERRVNHRRLAEWALYRNVDWGSSETLVEKVHSLLPGHWMQLRHGRPSAPRPYYVVEAQVDPAIYDDLAGRSLREITAEIESLIVTAVRDRLVSDVPVGTLCSGGIDSSLITALAARDLPNLQVFHVSVAGHPALDESRYAKQATDALGLELLIYSMEAQDFRANLARAIYHSDSPLTHPNSVAFLLISEFARQHGVEVLLSGEAADELFGGYVPRYRRHAADAPAAAPPGAAPGQGPTGHRACRLRRGGRPDHDVLGVPGAAAPCAGVPGPLRARGPAPALGRGLRLSSPIRRSAPCSAPCSPT